MTVGSHRPLLWTVWNPAKRLADGTGRRIEGMARTKSCPFGTSQTPQIRGLRQPAQFRQFALCVLNCPIMLDFVTQRAYELPEAKSRTYKLQL